MHQKVIMSRDIHILLVEDDEVEAEAVKRAFRRQNLPNDITVVQDGIEALKALRSEAGYPKIPWPYVILLDINMPRMNGIEFLQAMRHDVKLRRGIVFVLTTSEREEDKLAAYDQHIAGYLVKARAGTDFADLTTLLDTYRRLVDFPPEGAS